MAVEDAVEGLEQQLGRECIFSPESGIQGEWGCGDEGGGLTLVGAKIGALTSVDAYIHEEDQSPDFMDRLAAEQFRAILAAIPVPDDVLPSKAELTEAVRANWPMEIGDGWILGFERNGILRTLTVRYLEPGG
ncbi:MAG: hypothetical protein M3Q38_07165 [Chloroflexota bacterium]|nr:hypothetical protein [Chloroflexota bacterium]